MSVGLHLEEMDFRLGKYLSCKTFPDCNRVADSALTTQSDEEVDDAGETYVSAVKGNAISAGCDCHSVPLMLNKAFRTNGLLYLRVLQDCLYRIQASKLCLARCLSNWVEVVFCKGRARS